MGERVAEAYALLQQAVEMVEDDEALADAIRDAMDPLWYAMTDAERELSGQMSTGDNRELVEMKRVLVENTAAMLDAEERARNLAEVVDDMMQHGAVPARTVRG